MKKLLLLFAVLASAITSSADNVILYTTSDGDVIEPFVPNDTEFEKFGANIVSNTIENGQGKIVFDGDVTRLGQLVLWGCSNLVSLEIPNTVTEIGDEAFIGCHELVSLEIPNSVISIGDGICNSCLGLKSVKLGESVKSIGSKAFYFCSNLESVKIGKSLESIGESAFMHCSQLESINIPKSVTHIGEKAFYLCSNLPVEHNMRYADTYLVAAVGEGGDIRPGTKWIGSNAFDNCSGYHYIEIPSSVHTICNYAFEHTYLISISLPNSVKTIGNGAFFSCTNLTKVELGNSLTTIGDNAFWGCFDLSEIKIPNSVTSIGYGAFENCLDLPIINGMRYADTYLVELEDRDLSSYTIMPGTRWIGNYVFNMCQNLESIEIPNSVIDIQKGAFSYSNNLKNVVLSNSLEKIGEEAFIGCTSLSSVSIPNSVTSLGKKSFYGCESMTSLEIGNKIPTILDETFYGCSSLKSVNIPSSVTSIGEYAFYDCNSLQKLVLPETLKEIGWMAFYCENLNDITSHSIIPPLAYNSIIGMDYDVAVLKVPQEAIPDYKVAENWKYFFIEAIDAPNSVNNISTSKTSNKTYNLSGQPVGDSYRGIVVKDGKKIMRK